MDLITGQGKTYVSKYITSNCKTIAAKVKDCSVPKIESKFISYYQHLDQDLTECSQTSVYMRQKTLTNLKREKKWVDQHHLVNSSEQKNIFFNS